MSNIDIIKNLPDISFIDNTTLEEVRLQMINDYQRKYKEITGIEKVLGEADPHRLILYACTMQIYQSMQYIDNCGKQNFLKYSYGEFKDNLAALKGVTKSGGSASRTTMQFTLSAIQNSAVTIPAGTRVTAGDNVYFYIAETTEIPMGEESADVLAICTEMGILSDGYEVGTINALVDPIAYIKEVKNITVSSGGADVDTEEAFSERIFLAPSGYSNAGTEDSYIYWAKERSSDIADVGIVSKKEYDIHIYFIMTGGELPNSTLIDELQDYFNHCRIKPQTDHVTVEAPETISYSISLTYWIDKNNGSNAITIQSRVDKVINDYILWQSCKIGRDINPSELTKMIMEAGAKRTEIKSPVYKNVSDGSEVAKLLLPPDVKYGGLE